MSEVGAAEFSRFALQALDDHLRAVNERMVGTCQHKEALKASRNAFADALDQNKTASEAMKRALVANLGVGLTAEDEKKVRIGALNADLPLTLGPAGGSSTSPISATASESATADPRVAVRRIETPKVRLDLTSGTMPGPNYS